MKFYQLAARSKFIGTAALVVLALLIVGCSSDQVTTTNQPNPDQLLPIIENPQFTRFVKTGPVADGAQMTSGVVVGQQFDSSGGCITNGVVTLTIPEDAIEDAYISIEMLSNEFLIFELAPHGIRFDRPVTLQLNLAPTDAAGAANGNSIIWYDDNGEIWRILPTTPVDPMTVETELEHFSKYSDVS